MGVCVAQDEVVIGLILEIVAYAWKILEHADAETGEQRLGTNAG